jgi:hypothetical protein
MASSGSSGVSTAAKSPMIASGLVWSSGPGERDVGLADDPAVHQPAVEAPRAGQGDLGRDIPPVDPVEPEHGAGGAVGERGGGRQA